MAHLVDAQLQRFQLDPDAFNLAKQIYRQIQAKTAPGSGHELGVGAAGVPAIAAYLACVHLNSSDVDYNTAASASCVRPLIFKKTLGVVQNLVKIKSSKPCPEEHDEEAVTYAELMQKFGLRRNQSMLLGWFESAEAALLGSGELRGLDLKNVTLLRCVVFTWVCEACKSQNVGPEIVRAKFGLPSEPFDVLIKAMTVACSHVRTQIRQDRKVLLNRTPTSSANPTPSKPRRDNSSVPRSGSQTPSKSALKRKLSALEGAEQNTPSKRVAFMKSVPEVDEGGSSEDEAAQTPSKQRTRLFADEVASAIKPMGKLQPNAVPTTVRVQSQPRASTSQQTLDQLPDDGENPMQVNAPSVIPITASSNTAPTTPRRNRTMPSTPKRTPGSRTRGKSTPRRNHKDDAEGEPALPPRYRPVFLDHRQWYARDPRVEKEIAMGEELCRTFLEKFGQSIIDKYRPATAT